MLQDIKVFVLNAASTIFLNFLNSNACVFAPNVMILNKLNLHRHFVWLSITTARFDELFMSTII